MYKIVKGMPFPDNKTANKYPYDQMDVGDCMVIPRNAAQSVQSAATQWARRVKNGWVFAVRKIDATDAGMWRIK